MAQTESFYYVLPRAEMLKYVPKQARCVLDVGCGAGRFGQLVKEKRNAEVWGIELDNEVGEVAKSNIDHVYIGDVDEQIRLLPSNKFDCIVCNDVLEHLVNPLNTLKEARRLLTDNGKIVASIPNIRFYRALKHILIDKDFQYADSGIFDRTHLRFFTKKSMARMFHDAGYEVEVLEGINRQVSQNKAAAAALAVFYALSRRAFEDSKYLQFACVAKPR